jgi:hypothetical protein
MQKEKYKVEYVFNNISYPVLWNCISTPSGLADWFADKVTVEGRLYTFFWGDNNQQAELIQLHSGVSIRFRWLEESTDKTYFEFKIDIDELTSSVALIITDFTEPDDIEDSTLLWNKQIANLKRNMGI